MSNETETNETDRLAHLIHHQLPHDGTFSQRIPGLFLNRFSSVRADQVIAFYLPTLFIVAQGAKIVTLGQEAFHVSSPRMLMFPVSLPVALQTIQARPNEPFLSAGLTLEPERVAEFVPKVYPQGLPASQARSVGYMADADDGILNAVARLVECLHDPGDTELIAPVIKDEIVIRLLRSPIGTHIAEMGFAESSVRHITKAIDWLRDNFAQPMRVADLAKLANMSVSVFHEHFKTVTGMSPLQYQKTLRLQEARRLMLSQHMDAMTACQLVGYVSASQFSRDYSGYFGNPPGRDVARLRQPVQSAREPSNAD